MNATVSVTVLDGDSRVHRQRETLLWPTAQMIGIKPHFNNDQLAYNGVAEFSVALFDRGLPSDEQRQVQVSAFRDSGDGFWVFDNAEGWIYQRQFGQQPVYHQTITVDGNPQSLSFDTDWGNYRIEVSDHAFGTQAEYKFHAGWWGQDRERAFKPMGLDARLENVDPDNLQISLNAPFDGTLQVQLVTDQPLSATLQTIATGSQQISFDATQAAARQDAYLLLTLTGRSGSLPARAMAILPLRWQRNDRQLQPAFNLQADWRPDSKQQINVEIPGMQKGMAWLMVADKGITNITDYQPLNPFDFVYRKRKLAASLVDFHDRFYNQLAEQLTRTRSGGDTILKRNGPRTEATERLTFLHTSKPVAVVNGEARFELQLPQYTGEVMISVIAVDGDRFGQSVQSQRIISPITLEWRAPQAMVHGDKLFTSVLLRNNQETTKNIKLTVSTDPQVSIELEYNVVRLAPGQQQRVALTVAADKNSVTVAVSDVRLIAQADGESFALTQQIFLRAPGGEVTRGS